MSTERRAGDIYTYEGRLNIIFAVLDEAAADGFLAAQVAERVPWVASSHEIRAKLMALRSRDCVFYDDETKRWYR